MPSNEASPPSSDSEDDFMSDKFLTAAASTSTSTAASTSNPTRPLTYSDRRNLAALKAFKNQPRQMKQRDREEMLRRQGLETSLFERADGGSNKDEDADKEGTPPVQAKPGLGKAMNMMMKMGWKVGDSLGAAATVDSGTSSAPTSAAVERRMDGGGDTAGGSSLLGIGKRKRHGDEEDEESGRSRSNSAGPAKSTAEPIRISMWSGE
jgi:hypothetical protein